MRKPKTAASPRGRARARIAAIPVDEGAAYLVRMAYLALRRLLQKDLAARGLTVGVWYYLWALGEENGLNQRALSERAGINETTTTVVLRFMEREGLIRKRRSAEDRRNVRIFLTAKGRRLKDEIAPYGVRGNLVAMRDFSVEEVDVLHKLLRRVVKNAEEELKS